MTGKVLGPFESVQRAHAAADALAADLATWEARDPAAPSPEARQAIAAADAVIISVSRLRDRLEGDRR